MPTTTNATTATAATPSPHALPSPSYRALGVADVAEVLRIQAQCYGDAYVEGAAVFARRLQAAHHCSWAAHADGALVAYLAAYWSQAGKITPLQGDFAEVAQPTVLYLHDMAVQPDWAGRGIARQLLQHAVDAARQRGIERAALVAVQDAQPYWERQGFVVCEPADAVQRQHLHSYGPDARYMQRWLGA